MIQTCNSSLKSPFGEWLINTTTNTTLKFQDVLQQTSDPTHLLRVKVCFVPFVEYTILASQTTN